MRLIDGENVKNDNSIRSFMNFSDFWVKICKKTSGGLELQTLAQKKSFSATYDSGNIRIKPYAVGKDERLVSRNEFHKVWKVARKMSNQEVFRVRNYTETTFHASYILSIMKFFLENDGIEN